MKDGVVEERIGAETEQLRTYLAIHGDASRDRQKKRDENEWLHCLFSVSCPDVMVPVHEFEPANVPVMEAVETWPSPETSAAQDA